MIITARRGLLVLFLFTTALTANAQTGTSPVVELTMQQAIRQAKESNKLIRATITQQAAALADLDDAKAGALPRIGTSASYQRYTRVTLFDGFLGDAHSITKPPNPDAGSLSLEASFNVYAGGRHGYLVKELQHRSELASINTQEQKANIALQVAFQYLDMVRHYYQQQLIHDQVCRARTRSNNIAAFYANGKVTKSDALRAEVLLSNLIVNETAAANDYLISNGKLNTLLNIPGNTKIIPLDTASLSLPDSLAFEKLANNYSGSYAILKAGKGIDLQQNRTRLTKSFNYPTISLFGGYGFNYPNTLIFPPVPQSFAVGLAGVRITYEISSVYTNKYKVKSSQLRGRELHQQKEWLEDNIREDVRSLTIKYREAIDRMSVAKKSIEQAEVNYNIQNKKYFNQLSLLTDLLEADNLYQESRVNYIQANIAALSIYYRLIFISGNL